ncbi:hypothetical protein J2T36_003271 [Kerstersia gyiorum]|nr:hypothetical protein [Kerstersia gyiorum]
MLTSVPREAYKVNQANKAKANSPWVPGRGLR